MSSHWFNLTPRSLTRELPNNIPYPVKVSLMKYPLHNWSIDSKKCFEEVHRVLKALVTKLVEKQFSRYDKLGDQMRSVTFSSYDSRSCSLTLSRISIHDLLDAKREETLSLIENMLKWEYSPYTQNSHYYQVTKDKYLAKYKAARAGHTSVGPSAKQPRSTINEAGQGKLGNFFHNYLCHKSSSLVHSMHERVAPPFMAQFSFEYKDLANDFDNSEEDDDEDDDEEEEKEDERKKLERKALSALAALGYNVTAADFGKLVPPDLYEQEMDIMAEVRAYFHVAYKVCHSLSFL